MNTHTNDKVIKNKLGLLNLAQELGNISRACKVMGYSRDSFYRYRDLYFENGMEGLKEISRKKPILRILTDRGSEYKGNREHHEYEFYLTIEDIDHTFTKTRSPQTNGICERFHKTILNEFYQVVFWKQIYQSIDYLQEDLDDYLDEYNYERTHQGKRCMGLTPMECFMQNKHLAQVKMIGFDNNNTTTN